MPVLLQAKVEGPEAMKELLQCGKVCHRLLETCPHLCEATCHAGPCPTECSAPVTVSLPHLRKHCASRSPVKLMTSASYFVSWLPAFVDACRKAVCFTLLLYTLLMRRCNGIKHWLSKCGNPESAGDWWCGAQVRCACRRRKERRPCSLVRQQLRQRGLPAVIDDSSAAQLLGCDSKCHQLKVRTHWPSQQPLTLSGSWTPVSRH